MLLHVLDFRQETHTYLVFWNIFGLTFLWVLWSLNREVIQTHNPALDEWVFSAGTFSVDLNLFPLPVPMWFWYNPSPYAALQLRI